MLVSGDRASEVEYLAKLLDIKETYSSQTPEQKLEIVRRENKLAPTLFMGDGINDAPALTNATVGIAFGGVNAVTTESAGAVIMENTLQKVDELIHISSSMRKILLQSAVGGMALSLVGMGFASFGLITPVMGAIFQQAIDAVAIGNSLRLTFSNNIKTDI
jgi:P-type E1-E2 ATPase